MSKQLKRWTTFLVIFSFVVTLCLPISGKGQEVSAGTTSADSEPKGTASAGEPASTPSAETTEPSVGTDTPVETVPESYIGIYDIGDLYGIRNNLSANYILMKDIDMSVDTAVGGSWNTTGHGWTPIDGFQGTLDGNGHHIIGMHIYGEVSQNIGLFGTTGAVTIKNLGMVDVDINVILQALL